VVEIESSGFPGPDLSKMTRFEESFIIIKSNDLKVNENHQSVDRLQDNGFHWNSEDKVQAVSLQII
jgi:hypothetical protein